MQVNNRCVRPKSAGFTLVELIIVIAIIGILSAVLVPNYISYLSSAKSAVCMSNREALLKSYDLERTDTITKTDSRQFTQSINIDDFYNLIAQAASDLGLERFGSTSSYKGLCPAGKKVTATINHDFSCTLVCPLHGITTNGSESDYDLSLGLIEQIIADHFENHNHFQGEQLISDYFKANGGTLNKVDENLTEQVLGKNEPLYWRPSRANFSDSGKTITGYVMYASSGNDSSHANWQASMLIYNGVYYKPANGQTASVAFGSDTRNDDQMKQWLTEKGWVATNVTTG